MEVLAGDTGGQICVDNNALRDCVKRAVSAFDKAGKPLQLVREPIQRKLTPQEYKALLAQNFVPHYLSIPPGPAIAMVRVLVEDMSTGRMGSVNIPYTAMSMADGIAAAPR